MFRSWFFAIFCALMLLTNGSIHGQVPDQVPVTLPIHGHYVFGADNKLLSVNTFTGDVLVLDELEVPRPVRTPRLSSQGNAVVYLDPLNVKTLELSPLSNPQILFPYDPSADIFIPQDWDRDGFNILGIVAVSENGNYEVQVLNTVSNSIVVLLAYEDDMPIEEFPGLGFDRITQARWNPVFDEWIALLITGFPFGSEPGAIDVMSQTLGVVFNRVTGKRLGVNAGTDTDLLSLLWSPDGKYLATNSLKQIEIFELKSVETGWQLEIISSSARLNGLVSNWLGINDLLLYTENDQASQETIVSLAQIINNELFTTEFFRIPRSAFTVAPLTGVTVGDWHLTAEEAERHQLSCLFDHAQPARLGVGDRVRVNFTTGTPLRLREAPDLDAAEITQIPEGTEFDVIGGPACFNASDY
jgi:hypothetical protein